MKRFIGILIAVGCVICISAQNRVERIREEMLAPNRTSVLVVAHRADWRFAPENSLAAIENSIRLGADVVELDIQKTKDGQLILMHDKTLDRTTTGKGKIAEWTLDSIRTPPPEEWCRIENQTSCAYIGRSIIDGKRACDGKFG